MCGISGIVDLQGNHLVSTIGTMTARQDHRGPDDEGYLLANFQTGRWISCAGADTMPELDLPPLIHESETSFNLAFGHRRLSILDLSFAGHGPMSYQDGALWITYNGEIYNYLELRAELKNKGYSFHTSTDTEVILAAYAEWGPDCLRRFNGMFAFVLWDSRQQSLFCARDRFGIKPFHYYWDGRSFIFASEIKAMLAHPNITRQPNDAIIYDYLALGSLDHTDETFFKDVKRLPSSHYLWLDLGRGHLNIQRWWDIDFNPSLDDHHSTDKQAIVDQFRELLIDAVRLRLRSDVAIGTCLSGGLDSSSIVALANRLLLEEDAVPRELVGERQKTFSSCFNDPVIDERPYIQQVIEQTGAESNRIFPQGEGGLWEEIEQFIYFQEEPFVSTSMYSQWNVMRLARQHGVTVVLDGQGGDELLGGYHHYLGPYLSQMMRTKGLWHTLKAIRTAAAGTGRSSVFLLALGLYNNLSGPIQRAIMNLGNTRFRPNPTVSGLMLNPSFEREFTELRLSHSKHQGSHSLAERLYRDVFVHSLPALLRYEDRNSMAFSLEARVPFLDYRLVEFCFSLPASQRIHQGWTKWVLRQSMEGFLPEKVRWRRSKLGFATPERQWLREGATWVSQLYSSEEVCSAPYLNVKTVWRLRELSDSSSLNIPGLWRMVNLELWLRIFQKGDILVK